MSSKKEKKGKEDKKGSKRSLFGDLGKKKDELASENSLWNQQIISRLPPEIWLQIAIYLDIKSVLRFATSSRHFLNIFRTRDYFFKEKALQDFEISTIQQWKSTWLETYRDLCSLKISVFSHSEVTKIEAALFNYERIIQISGGRGYSVALTNAGTVYTFSVTPDSGHGYGGVSPYARIGNPWPPAPVLNLPKIVKIGTATGDGYSVGALTEDGNLYTWGRNDRGQLGINSNTFTTVPILVVFPKNKKIKDFALGWNHSLAVSTEGEVFVWGRGSTQSSGSDQLGLGKITDQTTPAQLTFFDGKDAIQVAAGDCHSLILTKNGQVYGLGRNDHYELGLNDTTDRSIPTLIPLNDHIVQIACGEFTSVALTRDGKYYYWGNGIRSPVCKDDTKYIQVTSTQYEVWGLQADRTFKEIKNVLAISGGYSHILVLHSKAQ
jgi:alpha-tubulin suppressor-like RCC1 family protein